LVPRDIRPHVPIPLITTHLFDGQSELTKHGRVVEEGVAEEGGVPLICPTPEFDAKPVWQTPFAHTLSVNSRIQRPEQQAPSVVQYPFAIVHWEAVPADVVDPV
jgi:hypothetical protein